LERKIYNNLAIITTLTIIITSIILSSLFDDIYHAKEIENLKNIATIITDLNLDIENLNIKLDDDININLYDSSLLPNKIKSNLYYDLDLNHNTTLRILKPNNQLNYVLIIMVPIIASIIVFALIALYIISSLLTKNIIGPIKIASKNMESILSGEKVNHKATYHELDPIIRNMDIYKEEIEYSISRLKDTEKMRREFTANISHELKTPLTSINGFAEMIASGMAKDDDIIKLSTIIHKEGLRLLSLIDSIINLSKLDDVSIQKDLSFIDLYSITNSIFSTLKYRKEEKNLSLSIKGQSIMIRANERMIEDLIFNLIDNAIKYNIQDGEVLVEIMDEDKWAILKVSDTGIGIPLEYQNRIFERFYMVDKSRSKKTSGTGLGLSIVKHIVEYHGGKLILSSIEGQGTTIEIKLPK
jgi:two-component system phosphate regulon sensor histidine kinase PhoR